MKLTWKHTALFLLLVVTVVALLSWFFLGWQSVDGGMLQMLGIVIVSVIGAAADLVSIFKDSKKETAQTKITQTGDGTHLAAGQIQAEQIGGNRYEIEHVENLTLSSPQEKTTEPPPLPKRGILPDPAPLPVGSRLPYTRNAVFTGREQDLHFLADALVYAEDSGRMGITQVVAATGLGGIGKTQLAVEFCYRYGQFYEGVHWLSASGGEIAPEIAACGRAMSIQPWPEQQLEQVEATLKAWEQSQRRLVILDNLEDPALLRAWLPRLERCRVLLTARRAEWPSELGLRQHRLGMFSREESLSLLRELAPRLQPLAIERLDPIAAKLGDLPLAIHLAGCYLKDRERLTPEKYLQELSAQENLLDNASLLDWVKDSPTAHATSLTATFMLSWSRLRARDAAHKLSRKVFLLAGWCAPNTAIPLEVLDTAAGEDGLDFDRALLYLYELGLLERSDGGPFVHPLLSAFARGLPLSAAFLKPLAEALDQAADAAIGTGLPSEFVPLRKHLEQVAPIVETAGLEIAGKLWNWLGRHLYMIADYREARACYERALKIDEAAFGPDHPTVATDVNNLGLVLQDLGDLAGALACCERALKINEAAYGLDHPIVAIQINHLGRLLQALGALARARACYERALKMDEAAYGPDHTSVAGDVNYLGSVLQDLGDLAGARACYERALKIDEAAYGPDHTSVARDVNNLGSVLQDLGDLVEARACCERALKIDEAAYGPDHPSVARDVTTLGFVLRDLGDLGGARACFEHALKIFENYLPPDHPNIKIVKENLDSLNNQ